MAKSKADRWLEDDGLTLLKGWARNGLTDEQIAHNMGIRRETLIQWKKKYPNINNVLKKEKEIVDFEVENELLKRATGYIVEIEEEKIDKYGDVHKLKRQIHVPGDVTAQIFWLKNRRPDVWREKRDENSNNKTKKVMIVNDCK